jgi:hypothetical protein
MRAPSTEPSAGLRPRPPGQPEYSASGNRKSAEPHWTLRGCVEFTSELTCRTFEY